MDVSRARSQQEVLADFFGRLAGSFGTKGGFKAGFDELAGVSACVAIALLLALLPAIDFGCFVGVLFCVPICRFHSRFCERR